MKRIGMVLDNPFSGDNRVINEAVHLQQSGFQVFVLALNYGQYAPVEDFKGVRIRRIPIPEKTKNYLFAFYHWLPLWRWFWMRHINRFVDEFDIEALHAHDLYMISSCASIAHKRNLTLVADLHENYPAAVLNYKWTQRFPGNLLARPKKWQHIEGKLLATVDRIVVLSEVHRDLLCDRYAALKEDDFVIYPNVPDHEALLKHPVGPNPLPQPESEWLFYFGVISERRGIYLALEALRMLREEGHDVRLLLAGNVNKAEEAAFKRRIADPEIAAFVKHIPWIDISEFPTYASACTAGLSPIFAGAQHDIGIANKVFQYMLFELPVIASSSLAQASLVRENECGLVFEDRNAQDLAMRLKEILTAPAMAKQLGKNGKAAVTTKFSAKFSAEALTMAYERL